MVLTNVYTLSSLQLSAPHRLLLLVWSSPIPVTISGSILTFILVVERMKWRLQHVQQYWVVSWPWDIWLQQSIQLQVHADYNYVDSFYWIYLDPPVTCGSPAVPPRGSVDISGGTPPFSLGSQVTYCCDERLFPPDVRTSTCTDVGCRGEWVENPGSLVCRERPGNHFSLLCMFLIQNLYCNLNSTRLSVLFVPIQ